MSYGFGVFLIASDCAGRYEEVLEHISPGQHRESGSVSLAEAVSSHFHAAGAGVHRGTTLVVNQYWPYDCTFDPVDASPMDGRLAGLSAEAPVCCLLVDETSMTFGISYYEGGRRVRVRQVDPAAVRSDWGDPLPPEAQFDPGSHDDSERIMALSEWFLGDRLDALIGGDVVTLTCFEG